MVAYVVWGALYIFEVRLCTHNYACMSGVVHPLCVALKNDCYKISKLKISIVHVRDSK